MFPTAKLLLPLHVRLKRIQPLRLLNQAWRGFFVVNIWAVVKRVCLLCGGGTPRRRTWLNFCLSDYNQIIFLIWSASVQLWRGLMLPQLDATDYCEQPWSNSSASWNPKQTTESQLKSTQGPCFDLYDELCFTLRSIDRWSKNCIRGSVVERLLPCLGTSSCPVICLTKDEVLVPPLGWSSSSRVKRTRQL